MSKVFAIALTNTRRFVRERSNLFFVFLLPFLIVLMLGVAFGGSFDTRVGVHLAAEDPLAVALAEAIDDVDGLVVERFGSEDSLFDAVERGVVEGGVVVSADYDAVLAAGGAAEVGVTYRPTSGGQLLGATLQSVVQDEGNLLRAAQFAVGQGAGTFAEALATARRVAPLAATASVSYREAGQSALGEEFANLGLFDLGAHQELTLFMFLTSLAGSAALIQSRRLGVSRRMLSTPTSTGTILAGEVLGRFNVAFVQGIYIVAGTLVLFQVDWGPPVAALAIVVVFSLVGAATAILMGALFSNDQQAGGLGVLLGLGMAALGGAMAPIEIFPPAMQTVAKATPHAWAIDAFAELVRRGGGLVDILPNLAVLLGFAAVLMLVGTWRLQRVLTR